MSTPRPAGTTARGAPATPTTPVPSAAPVRSVPAPGRSTPTTTPAKVAPAAAGAAAASSVPSTPARTVPRTPLARDGAAGTGTPTPRAGAAALPLLTDLAEAAEDEAPTEPINVVVGVRVRNLSSKEREAGDVHCWHADPHEQVVWLDDSFMDRTRRTTVPEFHYDCVLIGSANAPVYANIAADIVWGAMEGYHGTVFAYGQTNSGKTYTMLGTDAEPGIIPRAVDDVFRYIKETPAREFLLRVSYMEIYNETINDLLAPDQKNLQIHESKQRGIYVSPLREEIVTTPADVFKILRKGQQSRHISATDYNEHSSRSHTIVQMVIESRERSGATPGGSSASLLSPGPDPTPAGHKTQVSYLNLIDLAGSERSVSNLDRKKEGGYINKSLLTLGTVIAKLSEGKGGHVPYRDSKLTRMLQTSLAGHARVAVICTISPSDKSMEEGLNTLKFAARAKNIVVDPKKNAIEDDKTLLQRYRNEVADLRRQLLEVQEKLAASVGSDVSASSSSLSLASTASGHDSVMSTDAARELERLQAEKADMQEELNQQNLLQMTLQAKIDHLTKVILTSTSVSSTGPATPQTAAMPLVRAGDEPPSQKPALSGLAGTVPLGQTRVGPPTSLHLSSDQRDAEDLRRKLARVQSALEHAQAAVRGEAVDCAFDGGVQTHRHKDQVLDRIVERLRLFAPDVAPPALDQDDVPARLETAFARLVEGGGAEAGPGITARLAADVTRLQARNAELEATVAEHRAEAADLAADLAEERRRGVALAERATALELKLFAARQELVDGSEYLPVLAAPSALTSDEMRNIPWTPYRRRMHADGAAVETAHESDDEF